MRFSMDSIIIATKNKGKLAEFQNMLAKFAITARSLDELPPITEPEETGTTFAENALLKAQYYAARLHLPCVADDSGLAVAALDGAPGVYSARYAGTHADDAANNALLLRNMEGLTNRSCKFVCALALVDAQGRLLATAHGECAGELLTAPLGNNGFGYDPLFFSPQLGKTLAQATMVEKNALSHRAVALQKLAEQLRTIL